MSTDLRKLATEALAETPDTGKAARLVLDRLDPADYAEALRATLPGYVVKVALSQRPRVDLGEVARVLPEPAPVEVEPVEPVAPRQRARSARRIMVRTAFLAQALASSYALSDGTRKRLGDLTAADLLDVAEQRYDLAAANTVAGDQMTALAKAVSDAGVEHVSDLADETLDAILRPQEDAA